MSKKILFLTKQYPGTGGIERSIESLFEELTNRQNVTVNIICPNNEEEKKDAYIRYSIAYKFFYFEPLRVYYSIKKFISKEIEVYDDTILVSRFLPISYALVKLKLNFIYIPPAVSADIFDGSIENFKRSYTKYFSKQTLQLFKMYMTKWIYEFFEKRVMEYRGATIVTFSENVKKNLLKQNHVRKNIEVIYPGVDSSFFYYKPDSYYNIRRDLKISSKIFVLLYVGRLDFGKNIALLIDAFKGLKIPDKKLLLVGDGSMPILDHNDILKIGKKSREELVDYYNAANFLVLPSFNEGFGHVLIESLACGTPIIGFDHDKNAIDEVVEQHENGIIAKCCSSETLIDAIEVAYKKNSEYIERKEAISFNAHKKYNWENIAKRLLMSRSEYK